MCVCVPFLTPSHCIYTREPGVLHCQAAATTSQTVSTNEEAPRRILRRWGPLGRRPTKLVGLAQLPTAFSLHPVVDTWVPRSLARGIASGKSV